MNHLSFGGFLLQGCLALLTRPRAAVLFGEPVFKLLGFRRSRRKVDLSGIKHILVVRLDEIGDVVLMSPFFRELRRNCPDAWITLIVKPAVLNLVERSPYVNQVLTYEWKTSGALGSFRLHTRALWLALRELWPRKFDLALLPRWDTDHYHGAFLLYFSGASSRVGYSAKVNDAKRRRDGLLDCLYTHLLVTRAVKHEVERNLDVMRFLGGRVLDDSLEIWTETQDELFAGRLLSKNDVYENDLLVAFGIGAGAPNRIWPLTNFERLGEWLKKEYQARIVLIGGRQEEIVAGNLCQRLGDACINAVGKTTLRQAAALLKRCRLFVGNDAGPMHLAAAAGTAVVEISCHALGGFPLHPNSPLRFGPWGVTHMVIQPETRMDSCVEGCVANQPHCILGIGTEIVKEAITNTLKAMATRDLHLSDY